MNVFERDRGHMIVPSCSARLLNFFCRNQTILPNPAR